MKRALVVDDTKNIRVLLEKTLQVEGFSVETASTGTGALEKLKSDDFDLIFLDIKLPEISGTEVLRKIRSEGNNTPVIIITAYPTVKNAVDCIQLGAITYLQKPFTSDRLKNTLQQFHLNSEDEPKHRDISLINERIQKAFLDEEYKQAITLLSSLLSHDPKDAAVYKGLSQAYEMLGDADTSDKFMRTYQIFNSGS